MKFSYSLLFVSLFFFSVFSNKKHHNPHHASHPRFVEEINEPTATAATSTTESLSTGGSYQNVLKDKAWKYETECPGEKKSTN